MIKYIDVDGTTFKIDFFCCIENEKTTFSIEAPYHEMQTRKVHYRPERTWDDHMGNTDCGHYVIAKLNGKNKRVYMY